MASLENKGELGGYIELDTFELPMLHEGAVKLNCGRNALAYLIRAKGIRKILLPRFLCSSVVSVCRREKISVRYYSVGMDLLPADLSPEEDEWVYLVNYYGQLTNAQIESYRRGFPRLIVDNVQAYYQMPVPRIDTIYSCRKYFGVSDGAILYTDTYLGGELERDESYDRMRFLLGRYERSAQEFYSEYVENNHVFRNEDILEMSKLTNNLLHALDYAHIRKQREENFDTIHAIMKPVNGLTVFRPDGPFMYPLYLKNGGELRPLLQRMKIYIPTLWPDVFDLCAKTDLEYQLARNILPLPIDQRYSFEDMVDMCQRIMDLIE